jgi:pimeloyl-ACP methyl ester carboxylesterase
MGITTREIATDHAVATTAVQLENAAVFAVSQGGMIAQFLTIDHPELVSKLVLAVTTPEADETLKSVVSSWMHMARAGDYGSLVIDTMEKTYSRAYCKRMCSLYPILSRIGKPRSFDRFLAQAGACVEHSVTSELSRITARTLCIGGGTIERLGAEKPPRLPNGFPRQRWKCTLNSDAGRSKKQRTSMGECWSFSRATDSPAQCNTAMSSLARPV